MTLPMHQRIRTDIEGKILSGLLAPGTRLPTEYELMAEYGCSRMTVNKSLSALSESGLIDRRKGAGSFVARPRLHSMVLDIPDLMQEVLQRGQSYGFRLLQREVLLRRAGKEDEDLGAARILRLEGLHYADGRALALEQRKINLDAVPAIEAASFDTEPPGSWLLRHVPWSEAETRISGAAADEETAATLLVELGAPLLRIERRTWRGDDKITLVRQSFPAEAYDLVAKFRSQDAAGR